MAEDIAFDSYLDPEVDGGRYRLLKADTDVILPIKEEIRVLITSSDVIHS